MINSVFLKFLMKIKKYQTEFPINTLDVFNNNQEH